MGVGLVLALAAATANHVNQKQVAKKQDKILAAQITQKGKRQDAADQAVSAALRDRALSTSEQNRSSTAGQYLDQVRAAQAGATQGLGQVGAVSNAYQQSANDAALGIGDYADKTAGLMARIDAPVQQRQREARDSDRLQSELGLLGRMSEGDDYITQLKLRNVRANPWLTAAASLMGGAAQGAASSAGGGGMSGAAAGSTANFGNQAGSWFSDPSLWRTS